jgi:proline iminopeptidase
VQGPSELGASGKLADWVKWMSDQLPNGRYHHCPKGSHLALVDDRETYFEGLIGFLHDVDNANN